MFRESPPASPVLHPQLYSYSGLWERGKGVTGWLLRVRRPRSPPASSKAITCPAYLLAGEADDITTKEQVFDAEKYLGTPKKRIEKKLVPGWPHRPVHGIKDAERVVAFDREVDQRRRRRVIVSFGATASYSPRPIKGSPGVGWRCLNPFQHIIRSSAVSVVVSVISAIR